MVFSNLPVDKGATVVYNNQEYTVQRSSRDGHVELRHPRARLPEDNLEPTVEEFNQRFDNGEIEVV